MGQYLFPDLSFPNGLTVMLQRIMRTVLNYQSEEGGREGVLKPRRWRRSHFPSPAAENSIHPLDYFLKENQAMDKVNRTRHTFTPHTSHTHLALTSHTHISHLTLTPHTDCRCWTQSCGASCKPVSTPSPPNDPSHVNSLTTPSFNSWRNPNHQRFTRTPWHICT